MLTHLALAALLAAAADSADETSAPAPDEMEGVVVSATRLDREDEASAVRVDRLDGDFVRDAAASSPTVAQAIQQLPGVGAVGRDGLTSAPTIRGLGRDRSLILLEGIRLSSDRGVGPTASFLDPFLVRSVDVVRGASGVAYGSGAMGGVVSIGLGDVSAEPTASARVAGSTNVDGRLVAGRVAGGLGEIWRAAAGAFFRSQDDYRFPTAGGESTARNSGFESGGGVLAIERPIASGWLRIAALASAADDIGRPTTRANRLDTIEEENHALASIRYSSADVRRRTEWTFGFHRPETTNRSERFADDGSPTRSTFVGNSSWDGSGSLLFERPLSRGSWLVGADLFLRAKVDSEERTFRFDGGPPTVQSVLPIQDGFRSDIGLFAGWKRTIGTQSEILASARLDWARREADERPALDSVSPSLSVGVVHPLAASVALTGALHRSFRAPRLQELYFEGDRPGGSRLANPDLDPESAWSLETGVRWDGREWSASAGIWGLAASDLIVQLPVDDAGDTLRHENESEGRFLGAEVEAKWRPRRTGAEVTLGYAFVHGENEDGDPLPDVPPGELRLAGRWGFWSGADDRAASARIVMRAGGAKTPVAGDTRWWSDLVGDTGVGGDELGHPGFARWDAGVRVDVSSAVTLDVSVANLFDSEYIDRPEANAFPQPGRTFSFELTLGE